MPQGQQPRKRLRPFGRAKRDGLVFIPTISFAFLSQLFANPASRKRSPSWEVTRNGEMCHRRISLYRGFGRSKKPVSL